MNTMQNMFNLVIDADEDDAVAISLWCFGFFTFFMTS